MPVYPFHCSQHPCTLVDAFRFTKSQVPDILGVIRQEAREARLAEREARLAEQERRRGGRRRGRSRSGSPRQPRKRLDTRASPVPHLARYPSHRASFHLRILNVDGGKMDEMQWDECRCTENEIDGPLVTGPCLKPGR